MTARLASVIRRWVGRAARWRGRRGRDRRRWPRFRPDSRRRRFSMPRWVTPVPDGRWRAWPPCDPGERAEPVLGQQGVRLCLPAASGSAASASSAFPATSVGSMSRALAVIQRHVAPGHDPVQRLLRQPPGVGGLAERGRAGAGLVLHPDGYRRARSSDAPFVRGTASCASCAPACVRAPAAPAGSASASRVRPMRCSRHGR